MNKNNLTSNLVESKRGVTLKVKNDFLNIAVFLIYDGNAKPQTYVQV
jgi:hypothetical protein